MSFLKITQAFHRPIFPNYFIPHQIQYLQSPRSDLFHLPFLRNLRTLKNLKPLENLHQKNKLLNNKLKVMQKEDELQRKN